MGGLIRRAAVAAAIRQYRRGGMARARLRAGPGRDTGHTALPGRTRFVNNPDALSAMGAARCHRQSTLAHTVVLTRISAWLVRGNVPSGSSTQVQEAGATWLSQNRRLRMKA